MHLLRMNLRFLSPMCGLSTNPNQGPSSWLIFPLMVCFVVAHHQGSDTRPLCVSTDMLILEGVSCRTSKFIQGYGNLCHYSYIISMSLCGHCMEDVSCMWLLFILEMHNPSASIKVETWNHLSSLEINLGVDLAN